VIKLAQKDYIYDMCRQFDVNRTAPTPATASLFEDKDGRPAEQPEIYRNIVARLLWVSTQCRPDIKLCTSNLSSKLKEPTMGDEAKARRVMKYLFGTADLGITYTKCSINANAVVDASFMTHSDTKGQTGVHIYIGDNIVDVVSKKQSLTAQSSAEAELVAINTGVNALSWCRSLLEELGHPQMQSIVYTDNLSAMSLAEDGHPSSRTKHMRLRYFHVKERIDNKEITLQHINTENNDADMQTKPLPVDTFVKHRDKLMGNTKDDGEGKVHSAT
jgi:hypothetical protein